MKNNQLLYIFSMALAISIIFPSFVIASNSQSVQQKKIYHKGWVDHNKNGKKDIYEDSTQPIEKRIADLLSQMNVNEKTAQCATLYGYGRLLKDELPTARWDTCVWRDGIANIDEQLNGLVKTKLDYPYSRHAEAINTIQRWFIEQTRLGIPVDFSNEGIHGLNHTKATSLPSPIGIGSTWDRALVYKAGCVVGREAKALGYSNVYAPILDCARDPRWGRTVECYGEDPFLVSQLGGAMVEGIQSKNVASTLKHYAVYSVPKGGRDGFTRTDPHVSPRELQQIHLYPYRQIIRKYHPKGVMSSYNDWDGIPVTASHYFLTDLLRDSFGFKGYIVSDSEAVVYVWNKHRVATDYKDGVRQCAEAGMNVRTNFREPYEYIYPLRELVNEGTLSMDVLDKNVSDVLRVKFELGLFDIPYVDPKEADKIVANKDASAFMHRMACKSLVLLKNQNKTLPLDINKVNHLLITGPLAADKTAYVSRYGPQHIEPISVLEGLKTYVGNHNKKTTKKAHQIELTYSKGCEVINKGWPESELYPTPLSSTEQADINKTVQQALKSDVIIAVVGEDEKRCGECRSRTSLDLPGRQRDLLMALHKTGKPMIVVLINGQPLTINWTNDHADAILEAWFPNQVGGQAIAETLFGDNNPGGKLSITFPKSTGEIEWNFPYKPFSHGRQPKHGPNGSGHTSVWGSIYPFGYGLSYTNFEYSNMKVSPLHSDSFTRNDSIKVSCTVKNSGAMKGDEVVQLYYKDLVSSVIVYEYQLRGFQRITLKPQESKQIDFVLAPEDLELLDRNMQWKTEAGEYELLIGASSEDFRLKEIINLK